MSRKVLIVGHASHGTTLSSAAEIASYCMNDEIKHTQLEDTITTPLNDRYLAVIETEPEKSGREKRRERRRKSKK